MKGSFKGGNEAMKKFIEERRAMEAKDEEKKNERYKWYDEEDEEELPMTTKDELEYMRALEKEKYKEKLKQKGKAKQ